MERLELAGAPRAWLWIFVATILVCTPALVRGLRRRGTGTAPARSWVQRAPQLAIALCLSAAVAAFELIELRLGTGETAVGEALARALGSREWLVTLAPRLPAPLATALSWCGIPLVLSGAAFLVSGLYALGGSFSTDAELLPDHRLREGGPFRWVLHPVYSGYAQALLGSALVALSPLALVLYAGLAVPLLLRRARFEEALLRERFGAAYERLGASRGWRRLVPTFVPLGF
jgi:protein-S-isoprenylcysteine O-methyltransferase Ste14